MIELPRVMLSAPASGSGKTLITCALLAALRRKNIRTVSFKCGPDYIDPMFHRTVLGIPSRNLDSYFAGTDGIAPAMLRGAAGAELAVIEGVMGYYDGMGFSSTRGSSYEIAAASGTPVILVQNAKGASLSAVAALKGFMEFRPDANICGVIFNGVGERSYVGLKEAAEQSLGLAVCGYAPYVPECRLESRHLGLVTPKESADICRKLERMADVLEGTLDIGRILEVAGSAPALKEVRTVQKIALSPEEGRAAQKIALSPEGAHTAQKIALSPEGARTGEEISSAVPPDGPRAGETASKVRIGVARDEAFCFYYEDNLDLLKAFGAELVEFSPLHDPDLPEDIDGLLLGGGYPELYAEGLSKNTRMRSAVRGAVLGGLPCVAECGGFLYLHERIEDLHHREYEMVGVIRGTGVYTGKLGRFGYIDLELSRGQMFGEAKACCRGHEFHYYDSTAKAHAATAKKPGREISWECLCGTDTLEAGFPHLYYGSNPSFPQRFVGKCKEYKRKKMISKTGEQREK